MTELIENQKKPEVSWQEEVRQSWKAPWTREHKVLVGLQVVVVIVFVVAYLS